jgi:class 3 adenylate cyclase
VAATGEIFAASSLEISAGLDAGRVEIVDGEIMGEAVLAAADLCRRAAPGETLITQSLRHLARIPATHTTRTAEA